MTIDYSKFTNKSRNAIDKAVSLTKQCGYAAVEPQVLMVAIHQEDKERVLFLLEKIGVDSNAFFSAVSNSLRSIPRAQISEPPFSQELLNVLQKSMELSEREARSYVALEYIFWAFVETSNGVNAVMRQSGITLQKMADAVHELRRFKLNPEVMDLFCWYSDLTFDAEIGGYIEPNRT